MKSLRLLVPLLFLACIADPGVRAAEKPAYNYMPAAELEQRLKTNEPITIVDIQVPEEYAQHHIRGAIPTYAYPVKTDADRAKIEPLVEKIRAGSEPVAVVCPRGAGGAQRAVDYLLERGIDPQRLYILEKGQGGWSCAELTEGK